MYSIDKLIIWKQIKLAECNYCFEMINNSMLVPVNPFEVIPLQPNVGGNRNSNHSHSNRNDYSDNNFNYPFDNTRATYPPFDGSTKRPTFPTRRAFSNFPSASSECDCICRITEFHKQKCES